MGDDEVCDSVLWIEMMVNHDAAGASLGSTADRKERTDDIAEGPHTGELAVVAHDDKVCLLNHRPHLRFVLVIDENVRSARNPLEEIREDIGSDDVDICGRIAPAKPGGEGCRAADGIAVGTSMTGDDDVVGGADKLMPKGNLVRSEERFQCSGFYLVLTSDQDGGSTPRRFLTKKS